MEWIKKISKQVCQILVLILIFQVAYKGVFSLGTALATAPDQVVVNIGEDNANMKNLFNNEEGRFWYPGFSEESSLRLMNSRTRKVTVSGFGMNLGLSSSEQYGDGENGSFISKTIEDEYLNKMKIRLHYSDPNSDDKELLYSGSFKNFLNDGYNGRSIAIGSDSVEDVVYTIAMDEDASQSICNIHADIEFTFEVVEDEAETKRKKDPKDPVEPEYALFDAEETPLGIFNKLFMGYPDGTMDVNRTMNRAELACIIYRALNLEPINDWDIVFTDQTQWWYEKEAKAVVSKGYMILEDSQFNGDIIVTRQDLANILTQVFSAKLSNSVNGISFEEYSNLYTTLMDESSVITADMLRQIMVQQPDMAGNFALELEAQRLSTLGKEIDLSMSMPVTRLEVAKIFYRVLYLNEQTEVAQPEITSEF